MDLSVLTNILLFLFSLFNGSRFRKGGDDTQTMQGCVGGGKSIIHKNISVKLTNSEKRGRGG